MQSNFLWESPPKSPQTLLGNDDGYWLGNDAGKEVKDQFLESAQVQFTYLTLPGPFFQLSQTPALT